LPADTTWRAAAAVISRRRAANSAESVISAMIPHEWRVDVDYRQARVLTSTGSKKGARPPAAAPGSGGLSEHRQRRRLTDDRIGSPMT
jgi:hypothetical protein